MKKLLITISACLTLACEGTKFTPIYDQLPQPKTPCQEGEVDCNSEGKEEPKPTYVTKRHEFSLSTRKEVPLVKTVLIVDNSLSMKDEQGILATGVESFVEKLKGKNIDLYLYTTTDFSSNYGTYVSNDRRYFKVDRTLNRDTGSVINHSANDNLKAIVQALFKYSYLDVDDKEVVTETKPTLSETLREYQLHIDYQLRPNLFENGKPLSIRVGTSDSEIDELKNKLVQKVSQVGTLGSKYEAGLCSLVRLVYEQGEHKIFSQGDNVAFVILSDQDDQTDLKSCIPSREVTVKKEAYNKKTADYWKNCSDGSCTPTHYKYQIKRSYNTLTFNYKTTHDGVFQNKYHGGYNVYGCKNTGRCLPAGQDCSSEQLAYLNERNIKNISNCKVKSLIYGYHTERLTESNLTAACNILYNKHVAHHDVDKSTCRYLSPEKHIKTYELRDGVRINDDMQNLEFFSGEHASKAAANDKEALIDNFIDKSKSLFGAGFMVSAIIRDADADQGHTCPTESNNNSSYGATYKKITDKLGELGTVHSICDSNYGPALDKVEKFIETIVESTHQLDFALGSVIKEVWRTRDGKKVKLSIGDEVVVTGLKLQFSEEKAENDTYEVVVDVPNQP